MISAGVAADAAEPPEVVALAALSPEAMAPLQFLQRWRRML